MEPDLLNEVDPKDLLNWLNLCQELCEESGQKAFETMVEQMKTNPDAIQALYGD